MKKYDLIVVGGGISGVAASVSAARQGLSVLLIEKYGHLGGAMSNSLVYPFMNFSAVIDGKIKLLSDGIFTEMRQRFENYGEASWEFYKFVFDDMVNEAGVDVLFHSNVFETKTSGRNVNKISVTTKSGIMEFEALFFIDATGDGELIYMTGCDYQLGRESDSFCQPMTICFRLCEVDTELFAKELPKLNNLYQKMQKEGKIKNPREDILAIGGYGKNILHLNTTRVIELNPTDSFDVSKAETQARKQVYEMFDFLKKNSKACLDAELISTSCHIGVRESRKLKGKHILTAEELKNLTSFEDTIALGNYMIDIHNPNGGGTTRYSFKTDEYYQIPYRSLLPVEYDNMLVAGRCISATHEAHSAVRIMPICASMGEAAGIAISIALKTNTNIHTLSIPNLRNKLRMLGAAVD